MSKLTVRYATTAGNAALIVRENDASGRVLAAMRLTQSVSEQAWQSQSCSLPALPSVEALYFVFESGAPDSSLNLNWIRLD